MKGTIPRKRKKKAQPIAAATRFTPASVGPNCHKIPPAKLPKKPPAQPKAIVLSNPAGITTGVSLLPMNLSKMAIASRIKKAAILTLSLRQVSTPYFTKALARKVVVQ